MQKILEWFSNTGLRIKRWYFFLTNDIKKRPLTNFYLSLLVLVLLIVMGNVFQTPAKLAESKNPETKEVSLYYVGSVPKMTVQAQIEKTGVITIVALSGGVVQKIHYHEGDQIYKGNTIVSLSTNYQGGNASSVQREIADTQYQSLVDTFNQEKDILQKQRDSAIKTAENSEQLRHIGNSSRDTTRSLIDLNKSMLDSINESLGQLQSNPQADETMISSLEGQKAQLLAGLAQAQATQATADYQADNDRPAAQLERIQKDITLKQLDLQDKMLGVNRDVSRLQLQLAQVTEAIMYPSAPLSGTVQRVYVTEGDVVTAGQQLAVIAQAPEDDPITAVAYVPADVASKISHAEPSILRLAGKKFEEHPYFVSSEAVQGNSYAVYYAVPDQFNKSLTDNSYVEIEIPIGYADTTASVTYVPLDAIYQTSDSAYLFVVEGGKAKNRRVTLGEVYGTYATVASGLRDGDEVISSRNVVEGDRIQATK